MRILDVLGQRHEQFCLRHLGLTMTAARVLDLIVSRFDGIEQYEIRQKLCPHILDNEIINTYVRLLRRKLGKAGIFIEGRNRLSVGDESRAILTQLTQRWHDGLDDFIAVANRYDLPLNAEAGDLPDQVPLLQAMAKDFLNLLRPDPETVTVGPDLDCLAFQRRLIVGAFHAAASGFVSWQRMDVVLHPFRFGDPLTLGTRRVDYAAVKKILTDNDITLTRQGQVGVFIGDDAREKLARVFSVQSAPGGAQ